MAQVLQDLSKLSTQDMVRLLAQAQARIEELESKPARKITFKVKPFLELA